MSQSASVVRRRITGNNRIVIAVFSVLAFCIMVASVAFFVLSMVRPYMGVELSLKGENWGVESVDTNGAAYRAAIKAGDTPVEINGLPAEAFLVKYQKAGAVLGTLIIELVVRDDRGQVKTVALKSSSASGQSAVETMAWFVISVVFWAMGIFVLLKKPRSVAALLLCACSLVFGLALSATIAGAQPIPTALQLSVAAVIVGPWLLLHFFLVLPEERYGVRNSPLTYLVYLPPTITLVLFFLVGYVDGQPVQWFRTVRLVEYGVGFLAVVSAVIFNYFGTISVRSRQQMRIILLSCLLALAPPLILNILPALIWGKPIVPGTISILFIAFVPIGMGYAVVTQKLLDIDVIIRRGVIYGLVSIMMVAILSAAIFYAIAFHESLGVPGQIVIAVLLGGIATALFGPARKGAETLVDRVFYKDSYDYRPIIQSLSTAFNLVKDTTDVSRVVVGTTVQTLNLSGSGLFVKAQSGSFELSAAQGIYTDASKQAELLALISRRNQMLEFPNLASSVSPELAFLIPLLAGGKEVGVLCISQKISRQAFSSDDLFLLQGIVSITAMALHSAMLVRDVSLRDTFVSVASHELRTPLTSILGYADLLLRRNPPDATRKQWLQNILDSSHRISTMVDDLLNVSRIQSGKISIKLDRTRLPDILEETVSLIREGDNEHKFVIEIEPDLPVVLVDRDKFGQVIENLLSNAVKYSPGGGRVMLSAHNDKERHRVVVSISDEGVGIGSEDKASLFTTFHRIQRPETQGIKGSGLGLYIAKEWMEAMGGKVWFESELNKGSTFFVGIPTKDSNEAG